MPYTCLIVEREQSQSRVSEREFPRFGFRPFQVQSGATAVNILQQWKFDAAVIDADGFGADYIAVLRSLRARSTLPVLLTMTAQDEQGHLLGLESGATSVVIKPASSRLICASLTRLVEVVRHKADESTDEEVRVGPLLMDSRRGLAFAGGAALRLTVQEFDLLFLLASHPGEFVTRETIVRTLRGTTSSVGRGADVHVYRIRRKLKDQDVTTLRLNTIYGRGYCLTVEASPPSHGTQLDVETASAA